MLFEIEAEQRLRDALVMLGADGEMVRNWLHAIDKEAGDTPAHDQDS